jgi:hypothetical protein
MTLVWYDIERDKIFIDPILDKLVLLARSGRVHINSFDRFELLGEL